MGRFPDAASQISSGFRRLPREILQEKSGQKNWSEKLDEVIKGRV